MKGGNSMNPDTGTMLYQSSEDFQCSMWELLGLTRKSIATEDDDTREITARKAAAEKATEQAEHDLFLSAVAKMSGKTKRIK